MKKRILVATHEYAGIYKNIIFDLESCNYEVYTLIYRDFSSKKLRSIKDWFSYKYEKKILKNKNAKQKIRDRNQEQDLLKKIISFPDNHFDCLFVIRADLFTIQVMNELVRISKFKFSYHWDGINRFPDILKRINYFDSFYVFEQKDFDEYSIKFDNIGLATNFYFKSKNKTTNTYSFDVFYIGSYINDRYIELFDIYKKLAPYNLNTKFMLHTNNKEFLNTQRHEGVILFDESMEYSDILELSKKSKIILDLVIKGSGSHKGLSLRFFEALNHKNKIITDNTEVLKYDFYHPQNIFILGYDNFDNLETFIKKEFLALPEEILIKYSFINWFNAKLNSTPTI
jgi:hypothetical protein